MDKSRNRLLPKDSHEKRQHRFLLFYDTEVEMWFSLGDFHGAEVEIEVFIFQFEVPESSDGLAGIVVQSCYSL